MIAIEERIVEFSSGGALLHGVLHTPDQEQGRALVFCHPFAEEKKCAHRAMVEAARACAAAGWTVLRFDLRGCGDSAGSFSAFDLDDWCEDISNAVNCVQETTDSERVGLLGLRLGGTLAARVAEQRPETSCLVLWEPVSDGARYVAHNLRRSLIKAVLTSREGGKDSEAAVSVRGAEGGTDFAGYWVTDRLQEQMKEVDLLSRPGQYKGPVLVVNLTSGQQVAESLQRLTGNYQHGQAVAVRQEPFWQRIGIIDPGPAIAATVQWLRQL